MRGVRKNRYREATRTLQSGVPDNLRGCWSRLYPKASRSKYQVSKNSRSGSGDAVFYRSLNLDSGTNSVAGGCFRKLNSRPLTFTLGLLNETSTFTANFVVESRSARASCSC